MEDTPEDRKKAPPSLERADKRRVRMKQYFRYNDEELEERAWLLLEKADLTENDILEFCRGEHLNRRTPKDNPIQSAYRARRLELHELMKKWNTGEAFVDIDGRLRPMDGNRNLPGLPPIPPRAAAAAANNRQHPQQPMQDPNHDQQQHRRRQRAENDIARAVQRYHDEGVLDSSLQLLPLPLPEPAEPESLTFRRIVIAVVIVVLAFLSMLIQTLNRQTTSASGSVVPLQMETILRSRDFLQHVVECGLENRNGTIKTELDTSWWSSLPRWWSGTNNCDQGVLVVPSPSHIIRRLMKAATSREVQLWEPYINPNLGVNATWWIPCDRTIGHSSAGECTASCFRGVHDDIVSHQDVHRVVWFGGQMITNGGDHFDIHYNVSLVETSLPTVLSKLQALLRGNYGIADPRPVAFRIHASAPWSGAGVMSSDPLSNLLNSTNYRQWMEMAAYQNRLAAHFPIPWPLTLISPVRDTCNLLADQQANDLFTLHTSVFLSEEESLFLFVDEKDKLVTRGLAIEPSVGRVVVSTGGLENRRCRLPTYSGVAATLQLWWRIQ